MDGIKKITSEVKSAVAKSVEPMKNLTNQAKNMASQSASSVSQMKAQMKGYSNSIQGTAKQQEYLKAKIEDLKYLLSQADMGLEVGDTTKIEADIEKFENRLSKLQEKEAKIKVDIDTKDVKPELNNLGDYIRSFIDGFKKGCKEGGKLAGQYLVNFFKASSKKIVSVIKGISNSIKSIADKTKNVGNRISNSFSQGIKSIKRFALGLLSIRTAISLVSKAMQSYLSYDTQLSNSIQNCWNVLGSLLAPILEYIVSLFSKAVSYVNAFVQALTGINLVARANAKALNNQTKSTKKLNEAQSSLDELHSINDDSSGGDDNKPITTENVDLDGLKDKLINADWYSIGVEIGTKINTALSNIDWDFIQKMAIALSTNLGNLLNGLVQGIDWSLIGSTIGNGLNTALLLAYTFMTTFDWQNFGESIATGINNAISTIDWTLTGKTLASKFVAIIDFLYGFVTTFDWANFGKSIGEAIMGFVNEIDWSKAGETISIGIRGLFTSVKNLLMNIDWQQLGNDIWNFISSIDWNGIIIDLAYILGQAIAGLGQLLWGFIEDAVKGIGDYFSEKFDECGGNIIEGLLKGILDAFDGIVEWLYNNICVPFIDGFKSMFGIHSPSTVMAELGTYLVEGLKNGLLKIWDKVKEIFTNLKQNIKDVFSNILNDIKETFSIDKIKSHFEGVISAIKNIFSSIPNWFKNTFSEAWNNVKNVFSSGGKIFSGIKEGIENTFRSVVNKIISGINTIISIPFNKINSMLNTIRNTSFLGISPFKNLWKYNPLAVPKIPSLATGGVLTEETLVRVAEYSNAKSNPEIISPKDMMKETMKEAIEESGMNQTSTQKVEVEVTGETRIDGDDIVITYDKAKNNKGYDGKRNPSFAY